MTNRISAHISPELILELVIIACGMDWYIEDLLLVGDHGWNLKLVIIIRSGLNCTNDKHPNGLLQPYSDHLVEVDEYVPDFDKMLESYYKAWGWEKLQDIPIRGN